MSRARRAVARKGRLPGGRAPSKVQISVPAGEAQRGAALHDTARHSEAVSGGGRPHPALTFTERPDPPPRRGETDLRGGRSDRSDGSSDASLGAAPRFGATVSSTLARAPPGDGDITAASRKAGELLNLLRPENDDET
jgi:hypothetical protein